MKKIHIAMKKQKGFTIVELLIVIVVIGILAAIVIVAYNGVQTRARDSTRSTDIAGLMKAIELYKIDKGVYPSIGTDGSGYDLSGLATPLVPTYIAKIPSDPKAGGSNYSYVRAGSGSIYGIRMLYETKASCTLGNGNAGAGFWGLDAC